jgi:hypothetical protein
MPPRKVVLSALLRFNEPVSTSRPGYASPAGRTMKAIATRLRAEMAAPILPARYALVFDPDGTLLGMVSPDIRMKILILVCTDCVMMQAAKKWRGLVPPRYYIIKSCSCQ